jgi:hypothetical protein
MNKKSNVNKLNRLQKRVDNLTRKVSNNAPVAISRNSRNDAKDHYSTKGKERISDISALNPSYACRGVFINPANASLFPWLSGIATKYDKYHFKRLIFRYKPALPTSEGGNVYMGVDYNTLDPAPPSSIQFCQMTHWTTNVAWKPNELAVDTKDCGWLYTRTGPVPNADYKTYDLGKLFLAVEGISYTGPVGYFEVEYDIELARRQPDYVSSSVLEADTSIWSWFSTPAAGVTIDTKGTWNPSSVVPKVNKTNDCILVTSGGLIIKIPGVYRISFKASSYDVTMKQNDTTLINSVDQANIVLPLSTDDVITVNNGSSSSILTIYSFNIVKLN